MNPSHPPCPYHAGFAAHVLDTTTRRTRCSVCHRGTPTLDSDRSDRPKAKSQPSGAVAVARPATGLSHSRRHHRVPPCQNSRAAFRPTLLLHSNLALLSANIGPAAQVNGLSRGNQHESRHTRRVPTARDRLSPTPSECRTNPRESRDAC